MKNVVFILIAILTACQSSKEYNDSGLAKFRLKDYRGAIADYSKAIELNPSFADAYFNRGITKISSGQKDKGCLDLSKAGELGDGEAYKAIRAPCN